MNGAGEAGPRWNGGGGGGGELGPPRRKDGPGSEEDGGGGGGGGGGSVSGFHFVIDGVPTESVIEYFEAQSQQNTVLGLPAPGTGGAGGYSPGNSGQSGVDGTSYEFRLFQLQ